MNSDGRNPKCPRSTTRVLIFVQLSTKYKIRMSNLCAQHDTVAELKHRDIVTCMRVNAIRTILQLTLVTHGHLLRVLVQQRAHTSPSSPTTSSSSLSSRVGAAHTCAGGCLGSAFSGAQKRAEVLHDPCVLGGPQTRGHNQKSKPMLGATLSAPPSTTVLPPDSSSQWPHITHVSTHC